MQLESALWAPVTMVISSTFTASPEFSRASRKHAWERTSESLSSSCALPTVREEWDAQDVPKTILKSRAHQLSSATVYLEYQVIGLPSALPVFMSAGLSIQTAKEAHCTQSEMKDIVCFLETVT